MNTRHLLIPALALAFTVMGSSPSSVAADGGVPARPRGPCDIHRDGGTPCVAAHSTTRALFASYDGPLYQVKRVSDGQTLDITVVQPTASPVPDPGGHANAAAQDAFCANTLCVINVIYDQSGQGNHLRQAPPGPLFPGPAKGAFDTQPLADMAPVTLGVHKVYGVYMIPGMGFRNNDARNIAIGDEPEGIYYVVDGTHYDNGCCFDYGNSSTNGRAVGTGTMETTYFGTSTNWGRGEGPGPWIMADMEAGLFSGYDPKLNVGSPTITWRFVTAVVNGGGGNTWDLRGGNAQHGGLSTFYSGIRPGSKTNSDYFPMRKQGAILLGIGGDNGNGSAGTFYEGVMTKGYPADDAVDAVQANIVAARYDVPRLGLSRPTTFTPGSSQDLVVTFTNTTGAPAAGARLRLSLPEGWAAASGTGQDLIAPDGPLAPGVSMSARFKVTSPAATGAGFAVGKAEWTSQASGRTQSEAVTQRIRNVLPVTINEVRFSTATSQTDQFIELYNAASAPVDISNWALINTQSQWAPVTLAAIRPGTTLAAGAFYLLGLSASGLSAPAAAGDTNVSVRSLEGFETGQQVEIEGETRTVVRVGTAAAPLTRVFTPVSTGPWLTVPAGATNLPVTNAQGFEVGQRIGIDLGGHYEIATVTAVGKAATQTTLAVPATAGATNVKLGVTADISIGDTLTIGTGARKEFVEVASVGTGGADGSGIGLTAALQRDHAEGVDVSDVGTGISFSPATKFPHLSGDALQAHGSGLTLDRPLARSHAYGAPVRNANATSGGYRGTHAPHQWFGGPLSTRAGSIALLDASGAVVDAVVYGSQQSDSSGNGTITSPELATLEGDQGRGGCIVVTPGAAGGTGTSRGRFPDGADADSNCFDFLVQSAATLVASAGAGDSNVKVGSVAGFVAGQSITIGTGADAESAVIATVGTPGATTLETASDAGATVLTVASAMGFSVGHTISVGDGDGKESAVIASMTRGGRFGPGGVARKATVTVTAPLSRAHVSGAQVSGSGITLTKALARAHASGAPIADFAPTPGAPNRYRPLAQPPAFVGGR